MIGTICKNCGILFETKDPRRKHCSSKCKQAAYRNKRNAPTVTKPGSVTVDSPKIAKIRGTGEGVPNYGQPDCECRHCQQQRTVASSKRTLNHGPYKTADQLAEHEGNRVSLPGDADYTGVGIFMALGPQGAAAAQAGAKV